MKEKINDWKINYENGTLKCKNTCHIFSEDSEIDVRKSFFNLYCNNQFLFIERYEKPELYSHDDGYRLLLQCKCCGSYLMMHHEEIHYCTHDDIEWTYILPINSADEAALINAFAPGENNLKKLGRPIILLGE